jgi:serine/threonine protein phosphatase PrpC
MTAVEFLLRELADNFQEEMQNLYSKNMQLLANICEQAKEMEKQQIIDASNQTEFEDIDGMGIHETITKGKQYYNETFKNK